MTALLAIDSLSVALDTRAGRIEALDSIDLAISPGETVCLVGESGSGKTITALSVTRLIDHKGGRITQGAIRFGKADLARASQNGMTNLRGRDIALVFQEPMVAFDPLFTVGAQIAEVVHRHRGATRAAARQRAIELLDRVHIPRPEYRVDQYPHEMSGGMLQRAMIAMALACDPKLLIADEPTTALDVTIQAEILALLRELQAESGMAMLFITHDLAVAAAIADRVVVMYAGRIVEDAPAEALFARPMHPYARGLLRSAIGGNLPRGARLPAVEGSIPDLADLPTGCRFHPRCAEATAQCTVAAPPLEVLGERKLACWHPVQATRPTIVDIAVTPEKALAPVGTALPPIARLVDLRKRYVMGSSWMPSRRSVVHAVDGVSLEIRTGETFGLVGESGSGKSTLGRLLLRLEQPDSGTVTFQGRDITRLDDRALRPLRADMQMIFQDPYGSLDPRWTIGAIVGEPLAIHAPDERDRQRDTVRALLDLVGLDPAWEHRHPHQLSGGQRQRVAIARAIALNPKLIVADEAVSALDVSVRAQVVNLLQDLRERLGLSYLFIGHDLHLVRHVSDRIGVMFRGKLVETGPADLLFRAPAHPYTRTLLDAVPDSAGPKPLGRPQRNDPRSALDAAGCAFRHRCPAASARCRDVPTLTPFDVDRAVACHHPL